MPILFKPFQVVYQSINNQKDWSLHTGQRIYDAFNTIQDYIQQTVDAVNTAGQTTTSTSVGTGGTITYVEVTVTGPTTITPPTVTSGTLLVYRIIFGATAFAITWGGTTFKGAPPILPFASSSAIVSFIGGNDGNWWIQSGAMQGI